MIEFDGFEELLKEFDSISDPERFTKALGKACALVEGAAKQKAQKDSGELARSITSEVNGLTGIVYTSLEYAPYVEYGTGLFAENGGRQDVPWNYQDDEGNWHSTSGMPPHPYMRPALNENREKIVQILREGLLND